MIRLIFILLFMAGPVAADIIVAARTIRPQEIIGPNDLALRDANIAGGVSDPAVLIGQEARIALYAGRPIRATDVGAPALVERNQVIPLIYNAGGLSITTEGRALERAGVGEVIRIMNLSSRTTVTAKIAENGVAHVGQ